MTDSLYRDYRIGHEIGRGRFGTVYRCVSSATDETFAVKSIDKSLLVDPTDRECLLTESKLNQLARGPHVVGVRGTYEDAEFLHLVLDLCDGGDLLDRIRDRTFSEAEAAKVMSELLEAIASCHGHGVAHRDVKPENIYFDKWGRVKLGDFGSAARFQTGDTMTGLVGTTYYVAPEVVRGFEYTEKVDLWSAGVVMYVMLGGVFPFVGESPTEVFEAVMRGNLRFPTRTFGRVSTTAKDFMRRLMSKDVSRRLSAEQALRHPWILSGGVSN